MLLIVNHAATGLHGGNAERAEGVLRGAFEVESIEVDDLSEATASARAAEGDFELVTTIGGDGTASHTAAALAGGDIPLAVLPGGYTNVFARSIGVPRRLDEAVASLAAKAPDLQTRKVDVGLVNGRRFLFTAGMGFSAELMKSLHQHDSLRQRLGALYAGYATGATVVSHVTRTRPALRISSGGRVVEGRLAIVQNTDPLTYLGARPIRICANAGIDSGTLAMAALTSLSPRAVAGVLPLALAGRVEALAKHQAVATFDGVTEAHIESVDGSPLPLEADGDYLGDFADVRFGIEPAALTVIA